MIPRFTALIRTTAVATAVLAPLGSHMALAMGRPYGAIALVAAQSVAAGILLWALPRPYRPIAPIATALLLAALALGAASSPQHALLAEAGTAHALLYAALLAFFAATLRPGHTALVTRIAARLNPNFTPAMIPYTRAVTLLWTLVFAAQLATSALLLALRSPLWPSFVTILHLPIILAVAIAESLVRRRRWRHHNPTGLLATIRGVRTMMAQAQAQPQRASSSTIR